MSSQSIQRLVATEINGNIVEGVVESPRDQIGPTFESFKARDDDIKAKVAMQAGDMAEPKDGRGDHIILVIGQRIKTSGLG